MYNITHFSSSLNLIDNFGLCSYHSHLSLVMGSKQRKFFLNRNGDRGGKKNYQKCAGEDHKECQVASISMECKLDKRIEE